MWGTATNSMVTKFQQLTS